MTAEILRKAASLMRERSGAAPTSPWISRPSTYGDPANGPTHMIVENSHGLISEHDYDRWGGTSAEHIASWHPAVALAVADWLAECARLWEYGDIGPLIWKQANAVARAYLGGGA